MQKDLRTWIEIDKNAIEKNYNTFRNLISPETKMASVVKSNSYGHDLIQFSQEMEKLGIDFLCVDDIDEALKLREAKIKTPILVLGYIPEGRLAEAEKNNISITVSNFEKLAQVKNMNLKIHIKVDTGLGRQGFLESNMEKLLAELSGGQVNTEGLYSHFGVKKPKSNAQVEGLYSHLAIAEDPENSYTEGQVERFKKWVDAFTSIGVNTIKHISASAAIMGWKDFHFDMVRVGIGMYGLWPSQLVKNRFEHETSLEPVMTWKAVVSEIKSVSAGESVGYDLTEKLDRESTLAIIPVGYWNGYDRGLSGVGEVVIRDKKCKVVVRIAMCMMIVDITELEDAKVGDEVTLLGEGQNAEEIAEKANTINYEIVTRINQDISRFYK